MGNARDVETGMKWITLEGVIYNIWAECLIPISWTGSIFSLSIFYQLLNNGMNQIEYILLCSEKELGNFDDEVQNGYSGGTFLMR
jgi:hypothetical protein